MNLNNNCNNLIDKYVNNEYFRWKTYSPYSPWNMIKKERDAAKTLIQMSMDVDNVNEVEEPMKTTHPYNLRKRVDL